MTMPSDSLNNYGYLEASTSLDKYKAFISIIWITPIRGLFPYINKVLQVSLQNVPMFPRNTWSSQLAKKKI